MFGEPCERLIAALYSTELGLRLTRLGRFACRAERHACLLAFALDGHLGFESVRSVGSVVVIIGEELGRLNFGVNDAVRIVRAIGPVHREQPLSAHANVLLKSRRREAVRAPPLGDRVAICESLENALSRR